MKSNLPRYTLIFLMAFLGLSALGGGGILIFSPTGKVLGLPLSILNNSPFPDFLIPGVILFFILGLVPCFLALGLIYRPENKYFEIINLFTDMNWAWSFTIYTTFALIIWIQSETMFFQGTSWLQTFYLLYSIPIILFALLPSVRAFYKK